MQRSTVRGEVNIPLKLIKDLSSNKINNVSDFERKLKDCINKDTSVLLELLFIGSLFIDSSDIHLEAEEEGLKLRVRVDGVLRDVIFLERKIADRIISRIKLLSSVKLNIKDRPQDGRFTIIFPFEESSLEIDVRMSALPSEYGETVVLRLLDPRRLITLEELGLRKDLLSLFKEQIRKPNGMILVTGPTGSGKTTTLYAFLKTINSPDSKIITIEEPIEYHLNGISQTETNPDKGYDFASGLKAIMRQDPDVILVGEIRDIKTTQIATQAALTGHLVFSTLHTNDAPGTISRLVSLGEQISNIAPAINMIIAQRLVRKICPICAKIEKPDEETTKKIKEELGNIDKNIFSLPSELKIPTATGCRGCNFTGYKGRLSVFEAFVVDSEIEDFLFHYQSTAELREKAIEKGMITVRQDALIKVIEQKTTIDEVNRIT
ncbi:MAG: GspE/PulE family protein [Patescibacteria group bacterium]|nr:GspE/PulE family protein [Patescibacteria group bacterium]